MRCIGHFLISCSAFMHAEKGSVWKAFMIMMLRGKRGERKAWRKSQGREMCDGTLGHWQSSLTQLHRQNQSRAQKVQSQAVVLVFPFIYGNQECVLPWMSLEIFYVTSEGQFPSQSTLGKMPHFKLWPWVLESKFPYGWSLPFSHSLHSKNHIKDSRHSVF